MRSPNQVNVLSLNCLIWGSILSFWFAPNAWADNNNQKNLSSVSRNAQDLLSQAENNSLTKVTGVEFKLTPKGLQLILTTPPGQAKLVPLILPEGNNLVIDLLDATLGSDLRNGVTKTNPAPGISEVRVTKVDATSIRVTIAGAKQVPRAEIVPSRQSLVLSVIPSGVTAQSKPEEEIEIVVTGQREEDNYAVPNSNVGTRTNAAIKDVPQSIQVIPQQIIKDQGATELSEVLRNVSGLAQGGQGTQVRGFNLDNRLNSTYIDGNRQERYSPFDLGNVEQVEVLKGPASVLYGSGNPGGVVNIVTEEPQKEPAYEIEGRIGNFDFYRGTLDFTGPLNSKKTILYRLNVAYQNAGSPVDFVENENFAIFPSLSFELGKKTKLTLEAAYQNSSVQQDPGLPDIEGSFPLGDVLTSRYLGEPDLEIENISFSIGYRLNHQFSNSWSLRNQFKAIFGDYEEYSFSFDSLQEDNRTVSRFVDPFKGSDEAYQLRTEVIGEIETGIVEQDLLLITRS